VETASPFGRKVAEFTEHHWHLESESDLNEEIPNACSILQAQSTARGPEELLDYPSSRVG